MLDALLVLEHRIRFLRTFVISIPAIRSSNFDLVFANYLVVLVFCDESVPSIFALLATAAGTAKDD